MRSLKRAIAIVNTYKPEAARLAEEVRAELLARNVNCDIYNYDGISAQNPFEGYDFANNARRRRDGALCGPATALGGKVPVFPVNLGEFGFIAGIQPNAWKKPLFGLP